jgi:uncharacterized membrane protein YbaN (DUF454 family)
LGSALFRPYLKYMAPGTPMPWRAKVIAIAMMLTAIAASAALLHSRGTLAPWLAVAFALCALTATIAIVRFRANVAAPGE